MSSHTWQDLSNISETSSLQSH